MPKNYYKVEGYNSRNSIGYLLRRGSKLITGEIEKLFVKEDVSFVQWVILMNLRDGHARTAAELCELICHDSGALTRILDGLEQRSLIQRTRSTADRRVVELELTKQGVEVTESFLPRVVALYNSLVEDFTKEEADMLIRLITRLTVKLSAEG
jgi:DNA-binding MarR family transcriptional regulator